MIPSPSARPHFSRGKHIHQRNITCEQQKDPGVGHHLMWYPIPGSDPLHAQIYKLDSHLLQLYILVAGDLSAGAAQEGKDTDAREKDAHEDILDDARSVLRIP